MESTQVVIIGGGATGAGILWDLTLRGIPALLLEQADIANGATGRCHGLLHSGGRYAVRDVNTARDCLVENMTVKRIAPHCVEDTGGLFVQLPEDDPAFFERWWKAANESGIPTRRLNADEAREYEPTIAENALGAFTCPDAHVDVFRLVLANLEAAMARGAKFQSYAQVIALNTKDGRVCGVKYRDTQTGDEHEVSCEMVINAAGGWAQQVANLAGVHVPVCCDKGTLLIFNHRYATRVVNRCRIPGDADILVPGGPVSLLGTSSIVVPSPDGLTSSHEEIDALRKLGAEMIPALADARLVRVFCGVRALYTPPNASAGGRSASRGHALLDHEQLDGVAGFVSIVGGKLTTYRRMAEDVVDHVAAKLGVQVACATSTTSLRPSLSEKVRERAERILAKPAVEKLACRRGPAAEQIVASMEAKPELAEIVCECEMVTRGEIEYVLGSEALAKAKTIADVGRRTRMGYGPCQGTYCGFKTMLAGYETHLWDAAQAAGEFSKYLQERWKGQSSIAVGKQLEQLGLSHEFYGEAADSSEDQGACHAK